MVKSETQEAAEELGIDAKFILHRLKQVVLVADDFNKKSGRGSKAKRVPPDPRLINSVVAASKELAKLLELYPDQAKHLPVPGEPTDGQWQEIGQAELEEAQEAKKKQLGTGDNGKKLVQEPASAGTPELEFWSRDDDSAASRQADIDAGRTFVGEG